MPQPESEPGRQIRFMSPQRQSDVDRRYQHAPDGQDDPFNDNIRVFVLNHDASLIYTNQNNFLGFQIADVESGKVLHTVEVPGYPWRERWNATPRPRIPTVAQVTESLSSMAKRKSGSPTG